ncbi:hypothetical protein S40288_05119 [Stachybotrys chartarum IBT 40288]|nr:hypothetical protein S40288_05119 [Stachybotrys chartarum IBT 40288]
MPKRRPSADVAVVRDDDRANEESIPQPSVLPPDVTTSDNGYAYGSFPAIGVSSTAVTTADAAAANAAKPANSKTRVLAPDLMRGLLMMIMAFDHLSISLHTWEHGTNRSMEGDGIVVRRWNYPTAFAVRTLTHLCGTGFTLLLGMGVVYLGRSRTKLGWSSGRLLWYFAVRCCVLTMVTVVFGYVLTGGKVLFMNPVLFALAVDYFLAGALWLAMTHTERWLTDVLTRVMRFENLDQDRPSADQPLLPNQPPAKDEARAKAEVTSWHMHNGLLVVLTLVTIWWNHWMSESGGHCPSTSDSFISPFASDDHRQDLSLWDIVRRIWFWPVMTERVMSNFPPLAWLSFSILGLLYGRLMTARPWSTRTVAFAHFLAALLFTTAFVLTRVLQFGNLSDGCLQLPENERRPDANPYLVSVQAFLYVIKYPPDFAYWALTLAGNFLLLGMFGYMPVTVSRRFTMLLDFGTTALFFYIAHMLVVFGLGQAFDEVFGHDTGVRDPMNPNKQIKGIDNLWGYFGIWALCMLILWPMCKWYSRFKSTKSADSIWRFF